MTTSGNGVRPCSDVEIPTPCESIAGSPAPDPCTASADICDGIEDCNREARITNTRTGGDELWCIRGKES